MRIFPYIILGFLLSACSSTKSTEITMSRTTGDGAGTQTEDKAKQEESSSWFRGLF